MKKKLAIRKPAVGVFGNKLRESRISGGFTTDELGKLIGCSGALISTWEMGVRTPKGELLDKLAELFDWDGALPIFEKSPSINRTVAEPPPPTAPPVPVTASLRVALAATEDNVYSRSRMRKAVAYLAGHFEALLEEVDSAHREVSRMERASTHGYTADQIAVLQDKARKFDDLQRILNK